MDDLQPATTDEFEARLEQLVTTAVENDVDVTGGWEVSHADGSGKWDVVVTVVQRTNDD